jgi:TrmH family RNA methyltransferase
MITSTQNQKIKQIRALQAQARSRRKAGAFVIEGVRLAGEVLKSGWAAQLLLFSGDLNPSGMGMVEAFAASGTRVEEVTPQVMRTASDTQTPQGILVVLPMQELPIPDKFDFIFIPDGVRDPGNLGTMLRTAAAAGVDLVLLPEGTVDVFAPKVVRAAMGAHFYLPLRSLSWKEIHQMIEERSLHIYLADVGGEKVYHQVDYQLPLALVIGGEAAGAGEYARKLADHRIKIPMSGKLESLNAASAAAILLFDINRHHHR